jgi:hypothetical protein
LPTSASLAAETMKQTALRIAAWMMTALSPVLLAACATQGRATDEAEPLYIPEDVSATQAPSEASAEEPTTAAPTDAATESAPQASQSAPIESDQSADGVTEVIVAAKPEQRHELIRDLMAEARVLLRDVELQYVFTGKGRRETLRGRPVVFALWSETTRSWSLAHVEIPRPPVKWKPGRRPLRFIVSAPPGIAARHVKGTGAERLMFSFANGGEALRVYGRKFPVFDEALAKRKRWREVVATARPIVYLPFTQDTLDPRFVDEGIEYLRNTANQAVEELRRAGVRSRAFPGELLADVVPAEVIMTLAVIEQTDDGDYRRKQALAFEEVLSQYGLKRDDAYRYSVSRAKAIGPMQFTNSRGNGTYALVVRSCPGAQLDPDFERGATNILNAMKAAVCLFDIELNQMPAHIRLPYRDNPKVLGIFPVAGYNGGPRNVTKLYRVIKRMRVDLADLRPPAPELVQDPVPCPCLWHEGPTGIYPVTIPKYNNENRWYIQKYQSILSMLGEEDAQVDPTDKALPN